MYFKIKCFISVLLLCFCAIVTSFKIENSDSFSSRDTWREIHSPPTPPPTNPNLINVVKEVWIDQQLDHFDESNLKTWKMVSNSLFLSWILTNCP